MTSHHILFTAPLALRLAGNPELQVVGQLAKYVSELAYEGRLQIINNIGNCSAQIISGNLPPGSNIRVDNSSNEVVVEWPAYQTNAIQIPNGSFEEGDKYWDKGAGWVIGSSIDGDFDTYDGQWSAAYDGRGISTITAKKFRVTEDSEITASIQVQQGASSKFNTNGVVLLCWYDVNEVMISYSSGNVVSSASGGQWKISQVTAKAPPGSFYVALAANANRRRENKRMWFDRAQWDHVSTIGTNGDVDYPLTILVRDSAGREAVWSGQIKLYMVTPPTWSTEKKGSIFSIIDGFSAEAPTGQMAGLNSVAVLSTSSKSTGKWYVEIQLTSGAGGNVTFRAGLARATHTLEGSTVGAAGLGASADSWCMTAGNGECYFNGNFLYYGADDLTINSPNDRWGIAYDASTGKVWFRKVGVGTWRGGGDPVAGTIPSYVAEVGLHFAASLSSNGGSPEGSFFIVANEDAQIPGGFTYWVD